MVASNIFNAVTTGISFKGVMMDIGHGRHIRWVKDTAIDVNSDLFQFGYPTPEQIAARAAQDVKKRWAGYNKMRGQYSSALEHAIPERFFNDTTQCNAPGASATTTPPLDPNKPACAEGISAVKAIAIAQNQGQKVFVINATNAAVAIPQLQHRSSVIQEVRASVAAGKEVTIHEAPIRGLGSNGTENRLKEVNAVDYHDRSVPGMEAEDSVKGSPRFRCDLGRLEPLGYMRVFG